MIKLFPTKEQVQADPELDSGILSKLILIFA